jgi:Domain of unknown function (DUF4010)
LFAVLFVTMMIATHLAVFYLGHKGIYALGGFMGLADVDPFILGVSQSAGRDVPVIVGAAGIVVAGASNNVAKGFYAYGFSIRQTGRQSLVLLSRLALAGPNTIDLLVEVITSVAGTSGSSHPGRSFGSRYERIIAMDAIVHNVVDYLKTIVSNYG